MHMAQGSLDECRYYFIGLYLEAALDSRWLRKPMVHKVVGDWAWQWATNKRWVEEGKAFRMWSCSSPLCARWSGPC